MSRLGCVNHGNDILTDLYGLLFQPLHITLCEVIVIH